MCVCVCVFVCVCVCVCTSIHREDFICLDQLDCQRTDQRCFLKTFISYAKSLHRYFRMHPTFPTSYFTLFTH